MPRCWSISRARVGTGPMRSNWRMMLVRPSGTPSDLPCLRELHDEVFHRHFARVSTMPIAFVKAPTVNGFWSSGPSFGASTDPLSLRYPET